MTDNGELGNYVLTQLQLVTALACGWHDNARLVNGSVMSQLCHQ